MPTNNYFSTPMQHGSLSTGRLMLLVIAACIPGIAVSTWYFGIGILLNILIAVIFAIGFEALALTLAGKPRRFHLADNSALLSAVLFGIAMPLGAPWWLIVIGIFFAIVIVKHAYGGLGQNVFNPAMSGYVLLLLSFPTQMTGWHIPGADPAFSLAPLSPGALAHSVLLSFPFLGGERDSLAALIDGMALATPLIEYKLAANSALLSAYDSGANLFARSSETGWELVNIAYLLGGLFLIIKRIISWHIPVSIIITVAAISSVFYAPSSSAIFGTPFLHLFGSATMIGAFFIATDPVSAATTVRGKIYYGIIIGLAIYSIRVWGSYLDSIAIAVLFGNLCAPALDHFCRPTIYGHKPNSHSHASLRRKLRDRT